MTTTLITKTPLNSLCSKLRETLQNDDYFSDLLYDSKKEEYKIYDNSMNGSMCTGSRAISVWHRCEYIPEQPYETVNGFQKYKAYIYLDFFMKIDVKSTNIFIASDEFFWTIKKTWERQRNLKEFEFLIGGAMEYFDPFRKKTDEPTFVDNLSAFICQVPFLVRFQEPVDRIVR